MIKKKLSYYPAAGNNGYTNPYSANYKEVMSAYYDVLEADNKAPKYKMLGFYILKRAFQADVYVYNWLENIGTFRLPFLQLILAILAILVVKCRNKKIIWMFHNIHPHSGATFYSRTISWLLFHTASLIVSHSREAAEYAKKKTSRKVLFLCHPIKLFEKDVHFDTIEDIKELNTKLNNIEGLIATSLFVGLVTDLIISNKEETYRIGGK